MIVELYTYCQYLGVCMSTIDTKHVDRAVQLFVPLGVFFTLYQFVPLGYFFEFSATPLFKPAEVSVSIPIFAVLANSVQFAILFYYGMRIIHSFKSTIWIPATDPHTNIKLFRDLLIESVISESSIQSHSYINMRALQVGLSQVLITIVVTICVTVLAASLLAHGIIEKFVLVAELTELLQIIKSTFPPLSVLLADQGNITISTDQEIVIFLILLYGVPILFSYITIRNLSIGFESLLTTMLAKLARSQIVHEQNSIINDRPVVEQISHPFRFIIASFLLTHSIVMVLVIVQYGASSEAVILSQHPWLFIFGVILLKATLFWYEFTQYK